MEDVLVSSQDVTCLDQEQENEANQDRSRTRTSRRRKFVYCAIIKLDRLDHLLEYLLMVDPHVHYLYYTYMNVVSVTNFV